MRVELVTIGTELLLGFTVDTNGAWIGQALADRGIELARRTAVPDDYAAIRDAVGEALARTRCVLTTGGLGPTRDDITKAAVAAVFGRRMEFDPAIWDDLVGRYARMGRPLSEANRPQAERPEGSVVLPNPRGTAPGLWVEGAPGLVVMLPGVPREMRGLMTEQVLPRWTGATAGRVTRSRTLRTAGIPESNLSARIGDAESRIAPVSLAYLPDVTGVDLRLTAWDMPAGEAGARLDEAAALIRERAGDHVYGEGDTDLAAVVLQELRHRGLRLAVAESCTGGLLGGRLTAVAGSSDVFAGAIVPYDNRFKTSLLGVSPELIEVHGAVSEPVAAALAGGAARNFAAPVAVGITGIAGPDGGTPERPVGTVWFGFETPEKRWTERVVFPGNRAEVRARTVQHALVALHRVLRS